MSFQSINVSAIDVPACAALKNETNYSCKQLSQDCFDLSDEIQSSMIKYAVGMGLISVSFAGATLYYGCSPAAKKIKEFVEKRLKQNAQEYHPMHNVAMNSSEYLFEGEAPKEKGIPIPKRVFYTLFLGGAAVLSTSTTWGLTQVSTVVNHLVCDRLQKWCPNSGSDAVQACDWGVDYIGQVIAGIIAQMAGQD